MENINFINLTPHKLNIVRESGIIATFNSEGVARLATSVKEHPSIAGFPVTSQVLGEITDLPEPQEGTIYIVSSLVMMKARRADVVAPGPAIRDDEGRIIGANGLSAHPDLEEL